MLKLFRLIGYFYSKRKPLFDVALGVLTFVFLFLIVNFFIYLFVTLNADEIAIFKFIGKGFVHVVVVSYIFSRFAYKYLVNKLFGELFVEHKEEVFEKVEQFLIENEHTSNLTVSDEDNYLLNMNRYIYSLPSFLRVIFAKGLSFVPFYDIYQASLEQDLTQEERVKWLVNHLKSSTMERFDNRKNVIVLLAIPIINWAILVIYLFE
jgi:hypothetical protein